MSGLGIKLFTDEDVDPELAVQLTEQGYDILSCHAAGRAGRKISDEQQFAFAVSAGRSILVYNLSDYAAIARAWAAKDRDHFGLVFVEAQLPIGELVRRVKLHLDTVTPQHQYNVTMHLSR